MSSKRWGVLVLSVTGCVLLAWSASAQVRTAETMRGKERPSRDVTLTGRVVDLHCFMTGNMPSADPVRCTADCIRAGVAAGLETSGGLVVLGQGTQGAARTLVTFAFEEVEVTGRLFEHAGVKYLDIKEIDFVHAEEDEADEPGPENEE